jgi:hypothetical protein
MSRQCATPIAALMEAEMKNGYSLATVLLSLGKHHTSNAAVFLVLGFLTLCSDTPVQSQVSTASLSGTVRDTTGALVPGAKIVAVQTETNFTTQTISGSDGAFSFPTIPIGPYVVRVTQSGFKTYEESGIVLTVGQVATVQINMTVGEVTQNISVTAEAPRVDSTTSTIQDTLDSKTVTDIPLNGRNPADLLYTVAGTTNALSSPSSTYANSTVQEGDATLSSENAPTTNGVRPGGTYFSLDGAGNVDPFNLNGGVFPNPDATQEFAVVTGTYGARYVSAPGGAVNIVTKSGTNQIHGTVFEFIRNGYFNARNYFSPVADTLKRNQFGFAAGAPMLKDEFFIFGSYQGLIQRQPQILNEVVGTTAERQGNMTSAITGQTVTVPISTVTGNLLNYIPAANAYTPGTNVLNYYNATIPGKYDDQQGVLRLDYLLGQHRLFARYFGDYVSVPANPMVGNNALTASQGNNKSWETVAIGDTWSTKSGSWVVDNDVSGVRVRASNFNSSTLAPLNIQALGAIDINPGTIPTLSVFYATDGFIVGGGANSSFPRTSWDYNLNVLHPFGKHQLSFGTNFRAVNLDESNDSGQNPAFVFIGLTSTILYGPLNDNPFADFIMGNPYEFVQADGIYSDVKGKLFGLFVEDKYRATSRLSLTGGLRWDPYFPFVPANNHIDCWNPGQQSGVFTNAPLGLIYPGDPNCGAGGATTKYNMVQPRLGIAYQLDQKGTAALRAGWGMYATQAQLQSLVGFSAPPFVRSFVEIGNFFQSVDDPYGSNGVSNPFAGGFHNASYSPPSNVTFPVSTGFSISAINRGFRPAYTEQWSLSLQKAFTSSDSVELAYVGTKSINVAQTYDVNLPVYGPGASQANENERRPYFSEGLERILMLRSDSSGSYNGFNATYKHYGKGGLDLSTSFNWSKCLDEGSQPATTGAVTENDDNPRLLYGRCDFDQNLSSVSTVIWNSPDLKGHNPWIRAFAGSWTISGLINATAGFPYTVADGGDNSYTGNGHDMADVVPGVSPTAGTTKLRKLNYDAFTNNAPGTYGNSGRNSFRSNPWIHVDPSVMKTFPFITERTQLTFRAEAFNVFNHPNFYGPASDYNSGPLNFGVITTARDPRILQFALKLTF